MTLDRPMSSPVNRRAALTVIAGGAAASVLEPAKSRPTDPVFGLIEAHRKALAALEAALKDIPPGRLSADPEKENLFLSLEDSARCELATTMPQTMGGMYAVLRYVADSKHWTFAEDDLMSVIVAASETLKAFGVPADGGGQ